MLETVINIFDSIAFYLLIGFIVIVFFGGIFYVIMKNLRSF